MQNNLELNIENKGNVKTILNFFSFMVSVTLFMYATERFNNSVHTTTRIIYHAHKLNETPSIEVCARS